MRADITRRDFLNAVALGTGAALLGHTGARVSRTTPAGRSGSAVGSGLAVAPVDGRSGHRRLRHLERQHMGGR